VVCDGVDDEGADGCGGGSSVTANAEFAEYAKLTQSKAELDGYFGD
jgi:hypothetical protein